MLRKLLIPLSAVLFLACNEDGAFEANQASSYTGSGNVKVAANSEAPQLGSPAEKDIVVDAIVENGEEDSEDQKTGEDPNFPKDSENVSDDLSDKEKAEVFAVCDKGLTDKNPVKINGNRGSQSVQTDEFFFAKINGNQSSLVLNLSSDDEEAKLSGTCLFLAGNQAKAQILIEADVGLIHIIARGNRAKVDIVVAEGVSVDRLNIDAKGNAPEINYEGEIQEISQ